MLRIKVFFPRAIILLGEIIPTYHIKMPISKVPLGSIAELFPNSPAKFQTPRQYATFTTTSSGKSAKCFF
jgi:hypothetical protein